MSNIIILLLADAQPSQPDRPIVISMTEPQIQIVSIGQTVKFDCNARPTVNIQGFCSKHKIYCILKAQDYRFVKFCTVTPARGMEFVDLEIFFFSGCNFFTCLLRLLASASL